MTRNLVLGATVIALSLAAACGRPGDPASGAPEYRGIELPEPLVKPAFVLTDTEGRAFDFTERTAGRLTLLFFGYTHCPDICPIHMANIAAVLRDLGRQARARTSVVFVTTDPDRDTGSVIRAWLDRFDTDFIGLRGPLDEVNAIQSRLNLASAVIDTAAGDGEYLVGHAAQVVVFTPDGSGRFVYPSGTRQMDWAHDLPLLLGENPGGADPALPARPAESGTAWRFGALEITDVLLAESLDGRRTALYFGIRNEGIEADTLLAVSTPLADGVTLHRTIAGGAMAPIGRIPIPAGGGVRFAPRGLHGMLAGIRAPLVVGTNVPVEMSFSRAGAVLVRADVVRYEDLDRLTEPAVEPEP